MPIPVKPEEGFRKIIANYSYANINLCYHCSICVSGCPVNIAAGHLDPRKLVLMANLGLLDELVQMPEIWYCYACNRCSNLCPMTVRPASLIRYLRQEAVHRRLVAGETIKRQEKLCAQLYRILWHASSQTQSGQSVSHIMAKWDYWRKIPVKPSAGKVIFRRLAYNSKLFKKSMENYSGSLTNFNSCFTCYECSSTCPLCYERSVFDPLWIFRMTSLGLKEEILRSPSIWLCIFCKSCTNACSQEIKGDFLIRHLQDMAIEEGFVDIDFPRRWEEIRNSVCVRFLEEVDAVIGSS